MRVLTWVLGSLVAVATAAYVTKQRTKKSTVDQFLRAIEAKRVAVHAEWDSIPARNIREQWFEGIADDDAFRFSARTDKSSTEWGFALAWKGETTFERWNILKQGRTRTLAAIHLALKRLPVRQEGG